MGDTVAAILERQKRDSFWPRLLGWARQNVLLAAAGSLLVAAILGYFVYRQVDPVLESRAIEDLFVSHYEQVGTEKYAAAFSDFSEAEQDRRGPARAIASPAPIAANPPVNVQAATCGSSSPTSQAEPRASTPRTTRPGVLTWAPKSGSRR